MTNIHSTNTTGTVGKICGHCKLWYPLTYFHRYKSRYDCLQSWCKNCCKQELKKYNQSENGKMIGSKSNSKQRGLGWNPIYNNILDEPYVWHHPNDEDVISIPKDLHELYTGSGFREYNHRFMINQIIKQLYGDI